MGWCKWDTPNKTLRPSQNGRHFADGIFKCIFLNENAWIPIKISMEFVPKGPINTIPAYWDVKYNYQFIMLIRAAGIDDQNIICNTTLEMVFLAFSI